MPLRWNRFPGRFSIILVVVAGLLARLEVINGRFWLNDFRVYYDAANALLRVMRSMACRTGLDSGYFKYAPFMAMLYVPLALLPYSIAAGIQYALIVSAFIGSVVLADRLVRTHVLAGKARRLCSALPHVAGRGSAPASRTAPGEHQRAARVAAPARTGPPVERKEQAVLVC
ncbi:MAG: DUF2029 domain-containing protein [Flavobacteriales bacterium]|nr:DUF2029 domain-containing protein [Flavobacteriales bacterium]